MLMFATLPRTVLRDIAGLRACEVIDHPAFAPDTPNGELITAEATGIGRDGRGIEVVAMAVSESLDLALASP